VFALEQCFDHLIGTVFAPALGCAKWGVLSGGMPSGGVLSEGVLNGCVKWGCAV